MFLNSSRELPQKKSYFFFVCPLPQETLFQGKLSLVANKKALTKLSLYIILLE